MGKRTLSVRFNLGLGYILGWGITLGYTLSKRTFRDRVYFGYILGKGEFPVTIHFGLGLISRQCTIWVRAYFGLDYPLE